MIWGIHYFITVSSFSGEMSIQFIRLSYCFINMIKNEDMQVIFTHLKLCVAVARYSFNLENK